MLGTNVWFTITFLFGLQLKKGFLMVLICLQMKVAADFGKTAPVNFVAFIKQLTANTLLKTGVSIAFSKRSAITNVRIRCFVISLIRFIRFSANVTQTRIRRFFSIQAETIE